MKARSHLFIALILVIVDYSFSDEGSAAFQAHFNLAAPSAAQSRTVPPEWTRMGNAIAIVGMTGVVSRIETENMFLPSLVMSSEMKLFVSGECVTANLCEFPYGETAYHSVIEGISESSMPIGELLAHYSCETNCWGILLCWHDGDSVLDVATISSIAMTRDNLAGFFSGSSGTNLLHAAKAIMEATDPACTQGDPGSPTP